MKTIKITFVLNENLQKDLRHQVISDGYGMRGKSKWVAEAIENLLSLESYTQFVSYNDEMIGFEKVETIVLTKEIKSIVDKAMIEVRKQYPLLEGVQSRIVRTSILQRLLRS